MADLTSEHSQVYDAVERNGSIRRAADELGFGKTKVGKLYKEYRESACEAGDWEPPEIETPDVATEELLDVLEQRFKARQKAEQSKEWMRYQINVDGPFGLAFVGDPHLDDPGCNIPLLRHHVSVLQSTPYLYGVCLGDFLNNWPGRLAQKKYIDQDVTRDQAWQLCDWFVNSIPWFLLIKGNHDLWAAEGGHGDPLDWMCTHKTPVQDWQAKIELACPNGTNYRVWAAHDFPGSSIYNPLHSNMRTAKFTGMADLYVSGHKHNHALFSTEDPDRGHEYWAARARGYKFLDEYAARLGIGEQNNGATITAIFDPYASGPAKMTCFVDLDEAKEFLQYKREKYRRDTVVRSFDGEDA